MTMRTFQTREALPEMLERRVAHPPPRRSRKANRPAPGASVPGKRNRFFDRSTVSDLVDFARLARRD